MPEEPEIKPLPPTASGLQLHRIQGERLISCEPIHFDRGSVGVETVLRRASLSGRVEIGGDLADHFADIHDREGNLLESVSLDRTSYRALKYHWMPCKIAKTP